LLFRACLHQNFALTIVGERPEIFRRQGEFYRIEESGLQKLTVVWRSDQEYSVPRERCEEAHGAEHGYTTPSK